MQVTHRCLREALHVTRLGMISTHPLILNKWLPGYAVFLSYSRDLHMRGKNSYGMYAFTLGH